MRFAFLIDRWQPRRGGAEVALEALAEHLAAEGDEVLAFGRLGPREGEVTAAEFHRVRGGPMARMGHRGLRERVFGRAITAAAERAKADVTIGVRHLERVHVLWLHGGCHVATMEARHRARNGGELPDHGLRVHGRHRAFVALERRAMLGGAKAIVCPSELVRREVLARYPEAADRLQVAPSGVDLERFHPRNRPEAARALRARLQVGPGVPLLVLAARNPELKGFPELLAALAPLQHLPWRLVLAGPKRPRSWVQLVRRRGLAGRVSVTRHLDPVVLAAGADVCLLPTWRDTSGLVVLEALASGTPVLTTALAGAAELLGDPRAGRVLRDPLARAAWTRELSDILAAWGQGLDPGAPRRAVQACGAGAWLRDLAQICRSVQGPLSPRGAS